MSEVKPASAVRRVGALEPCVPLFGEQRERLGFIIERRWSELLKKKSIWLSSVGNTQIIYSLLITEILLFAVLGIDLESQLLCVFITSINVDENCEI